MKCKFFNICILALIGSFAICQKTSPHVNGPYKLESDSIAITSNLLTLTDAEKIIGEHAKLTGNSFN